MPSFELGQLSLSAWSIAISSAVLMLMAINKPAPCGLTLKLRGALHMFVSTLSQLQAPCWAPLGDYHLCISHHQDLGGVGCIMLSMSFTECTRGA